MFLISQSCLNVDDNSADTRPVTFYSQSLIYSIQQMFWTNKIYRKELRFQKRLMYSFNLPTSSRLFFTLPNQDFSLIDWVFSQSRPCKISTFYLDKLKFKENLSIAFVIRLLFLYSSKIEQTDTASSLDLGIGARSQLFRQFRLIFSERLEISSKNFCQLFQESLSPFSLRRLSIYDFTLLMSCTKSDSIYAFISADSSFQTSTVQRSFVIYSRFCWTDRSTKSDPLQFFIRSISSLFSLFNSLILLFRITQRLRLKGIAFPSSIYFIQASLSFNFQRAASPQRDFWVIVLKSFCIFDNFCSFFAYFYSFAYNYSIFLWYSSYRSSSSFILLERDQFLLASTLSFLMGLLIYYSFIFQILSSLTTSLSSFWLDILGIYSFKILLLLYFFTLLLPCSRLFNTYYLSGYGLGIFGT